MAKKAASLTNKKEVTRMTHRWENNLTLSISFVYYSYHFTDYKLLYVILWQCNKPCSCQNKLINSILANTSLLYLGSDSSRDNSYHKRMNSTQ